MSPSAPSSNRMPVLVGPCALAALFIATFRWPAPSGLGFHEALGALALPLLVGLLLARRIPLGYLFLGWTLAMAGLFTWLPATLAAKGPMPTTAALGAAAAFCLWEALGLTAVAALARVVHRRAGTGSAALAAGLAILAWERFAFHVYPWSLGAAFGGLPVLARSAAFLGTHGLSALAWGAGIWTGLSLREDPRSLRTWAPLAALPLLLLSLGLGWKLLPVASPRTLDVVMAQPAFPAGERRLGMEEEAWALTDPLLIRHALPHAGTPTLVLWPESSVLGRNDSLHRPHFVAEAARRGVAWLFGTEGASPGSRFLDWNLVRGAAADQAPFLQAKAAPMPFGERMPGPEPVRRALEAMTGFLSQQPGTLGPASTFPIPAPGGPILAHPLICSEALMASRAFEGLDLAGGDLLTNHTNDAWFGPSVATDIHAAQIRLRACETGLPLLRATMSGKSGVFREDGSWVLWGGPMTRDAYAFRLAWRPVRTPMRLPAWRLTLDLGAIALLGLVAWRSRRKAAHD